MDEPIYRGESVWCPLCKKYTHLLRVQKAAKLVDVNRRTIYRYIEEGTIYSVKIAGKTYRVCADCLLWDNSFENEQHKKNSDKV